MPVGLWRFVRLDSCGGGENFGENKCPVYPAERKAMFLSIKNARRGPRGVMILLSHHNIGLGYNDNVHDGDDMDHVIWVCAAEGTGSG